MIVTHEREHVDLAHWLGDEGDWETSPDAMRWTPSPEGPGFGAVSRSEPLSAHSGTRANPDSASSRSRQDSEETK